MSATIVDIYQSQVFAETEAVELQFWEGWAGLLSQWVSFLENILSLRVPSRPWRTSVTNHTSYLDIIYVIILLFRIGSQSSVDYTLYCSREHNANKFDIQSVTWYWDTSPQFLQIPGRYLISDKISAQFSLIQRGLDPTDCDHWNYWTNTFIRELHNGHLPSH